MQSPEHFWAHLSGSCFSQTPDDPAMTFTCWQVRGKLPRRCAAIRLKYHMPWILLTHSSLSIIVSQMNHFYLQRSLRPIFSSPLFRPSSSPFYGKTPWLLRPHSRQLLIQPQRRFPAVQAWPWNCWLLHSSDRQDTASLGPLLPTCPWGLTSSPASPMGCALQFQLTKVQWFLRGCFWSNALFDLVVQNYLSFFRARLTRVVLLN